MGKDYLHYSVDDFIADEYFQRWVKFPDRETEAFWKKWISEHPEQRDDIMKASAFINHLNFRVDNPGEDKVEASLNRSLQIIHEKENSWSFRFKRKSALKKFLWAAAAATLMVAAFTTWKSFHSTPLSVELVTGKNEIKKLLLPDSSVVTLNGNSSLKYAAALNENINREVWLKGEAFFDVKKHQSNDKARVFIVHSEEINVEVLGTSFNVKKREDVCNVSLNSGNIKIRLNDDAGSTIYLSAGDFFQYSNKEKSLLKKKVKADLYSDWKEEKMVLDNTTVTDITALIHDSYGFNTIIANKQLETQKISGTVMLKDEESFLKDLSVLGNMDIIRNDRDLIFQTKTKAR